MWTSGLAAPNVVETQKQATHLLSRLHALESGTPVAVDTEFGQDDQGAYSLKVWSLSWGKGERHVIVDNAVTRAAFKPWLEDKNVKKVLQNYAADADVLLDSDIRMKGFHADTLVMSAIVDSSDKRHDLKYLAWRYLHRRDGTPRPDFGTLFSYVPEGKKKPVQYTWDEIMSDSKLYQVLLDYSATDAEETIRLYHVFRRDLEKWGYWKNYLRDDRPFTITLSRMMRRGFRIDLKRMKELEIEFGARIDTLAARFRKRCGKPDINLNSFPQLQKLFFEELDYPALKKSATGYSVDGDTLDAWAEAGLKLGAILGEYRKLIKLNSTFVTGILLGAEGDRLYSDFNQIGAQATGRISSRKYKKSFVEVKEKTNKRTGAVTVTEKVRTKKVGANLQNIPTRSDDGRLIREAFIASKGHTLIVADFAGFEWAMMAHLSQDVLMLDQMRNGKDPHAITAQAFFPALKSMAWEEVKQKAKAKAVEMVGGEEINFGNVRDMAKTANFGFLYGCADAKAGYLLNTDDAGGGKYLKKFFKLYPGITLYQKRMIKHAREHGYVSTISGRRLYLPEIHSDDPGMRAHAERQAINAPDQGSCADVIKRAMNDLERDKQLKEWGARLLLQVHDELVFEAPHKTVDKVAKHIIPIMEGQFKDVLTVPLKVEVGTGDSWRSAK